MAAPAEPLRETRERELVKATRALFDERGVQEAPIEQIARAVGIARGLIYRQFSSKEELYVLTVTDYLDELEDALAGARGDDRLDAIIRAFAGFCLRYPAFLDCSLSLMRGPARDLHATVSESVWLRLGRGMAACIGQLADVLREEHGREDADYLANVLWTQALGALHLARVGVGVARADGEPTLFAVDRDALVESVAAGVRAQLGTPR